MYCLALDEGDIAVMKTYGAGPYTRRLKDIEKDIAEKVKRVNELSGTNLFKSCLFPVFLIVNLTCIFLYFYFRHYRL